MSKQLVFLPHKAPESVPFRPIHYLGNKWRVLEVIETTLTEVSPASGMICDLFSGSGVVAAALGRHRPVMAADIQEYARVLASALLKPAPLPDTLGSRLFGRAWAHEQQLCSGPLAELIDYERKAIQEAVFGRPERLGDILEYGSVALSEQCSDAASRDLRRYLSAASTRAPGGPDTVLSRYYGGIYFSYEQAAGLDGIAAAARALPVELRDPVLAALLSTASEVVSSVGNQFAQPVRPRTRDGRVKERTVAGVAHRRQAGITEVFQRWYERYMRLPATGHQHMVVRGDYREVLTALPATVSAIYADPPYTRDHYSRFYHVLETIAIGDEPQISLVRVDTDTRTSRGLYRAERHQSPFCIKSKVVQAFRDLIGGAAALSVPLIVSYSPYVAGSSARPRLMTIAQIQELLREYFLRVEVRSVGRIAHSKLNAEWLNTEMNYDAEVLIVAQP